MFGFGGVLLMFLILGGVLLFLSIFKMFIKLFGCGGLINLFCFGCFCVCCVEKKFGFFDVFVCGCGVVFKVNLFVFDVGFGVNVRFFFDLFFCGFVLNG